MTEENNSTPQEEPVDRFHRLVNAEDMDDEEMMALLAQENAENEPSQSVNSEADAYFNHQDNLVSPGSMDEEQVEQNLPADQVDTPDAANLAQGADEPEEKAGLPSGASNAVPPIDLSTQPMSVKDDEDTAPLGPGSGGVAHVPFGGRTPPSGTPALDKYGFPLPRRVDEIDVNATRVSPAAYDSSTWALKIEAETPAWF
jgi:hypothetical protein